MELYRERGPNPYRYNFDEDLEYFDPFYRDSYLFNLYYTSSRKKIKTKIVQVEETIEEKENKIILQPTVEENE